MLRLISILTPLLALVAFVGCSNSQTPSEPSSAADSNAGATAGESSTEVSNDASTSEAVQKEGKKILVVYFSPTGTTKGVAEKIAAIENADLYEIKEAQEYTTADLDWHDEKSRTTLEQKDKKVRPEIGSERLTLDGYGKIYVGFPIWWGEEPRILDTFAESYNFDGITMIPFCTSGGSEIGRSGRNLAERAGSGDWREGRRFGGNVAESKLKDWIDGLK